MADMTYAQLLKAVTDMRDNIGKAAEAIRARAQKIDDEAQDTARLAEMIGGLHVDTDTVAETTELARIMRGVSEAAIDYAAAGDTTAKSADAAHQQAKATHAGIQEAFNRATFEMSSLDRNWLQQE